MGMDVYKSRFLDGCPDGFGTKMKSYQPVSQIVWPVSQFFCTKRTHSHALGLNREALFSERTSFFIVSADHRLVQIYMRICIIRTCTYGIIYKNKFTYANKCV
jgi:hypothetical protein